MRPGARILCVVTMKLSPVKIDEKPRTKAEAVIITTGVSVVDVTATTREVSASGPGNLLPLPWLEHWSDTRYTDVRILQPPRHGELFGPAG